MDWLNSLDPEDRLVSVIITCHNYGSYLERCLSSIFRQIYQHFEVIVVDDGSVDQTPVVVGRYKDRLVSLRNEGALGCGTARNQGLEVARGRLCLYVDADDYLDPTYLEKTVPVLLLTGAGVVYCGFDQVFADGQVRPFRPPAYRRAELIRENYMSITSLTRTELVRGVGGFDNRLLLQDYDIWLRITHLAHAVGVPECLFYQTMHSDNMNLTMAQHHRVAQSERIRRRIRYGLFLAQSNVLHLVTGAGIRRSVPWELLPAAGLDAKDTFPVSAAVLQRYAEKRPVQSLDELRMIAFAENVW